MNPLPGTGCQGRSGLTWFEATSHCVPGAITPAPPVFFTGQRGEVTAGRHCLVNRVAALAARYPNRVHREVAAEAVGQFCPAHRAAVQEAVVHQDRQATVLGAVALAVVADALLVLGVADEPVR
jgi:hypothetical protein